MPAWGKRGRSNRLPVRASQLKSTLGQAGTVTGISNSTGTERGLLLTKGEGGKSSVPTQTAPCRLLDVCRLCCGLSPYVPRRAGAVQGLGFAPLWCSSLSPAARACRETPALQLRGLKAPAGPWGQEPQSNPLCWPTSSVVVFPHPFELGNAPGFPREVAAAVGSWLQGILSPLLPGVGGCPEKGDHARSHPTPFPTCQGRRWPG